MNISYYSQAGQDKFVCEYLNFLTGGYFIDIGANLGIKNNNTYTLEKFLGWDGICIEPAKQIFPQLVLERNCICLNKAIYNKNKTIKFNSHAGVMEDNGSDSIEAITLRELFNQYPVPKVIDYISLDVDGPEVEVLEGFPFEGYVCKIWTIEHNSCIQGPKIKNKIYQIMNDNGYIRVKEDVICHDSKYLPFEDWYVYKNYIKT